MTDLTDKLAEALRDLLEVSHLAPDTNCSCHISPPCNDCVEWGGLRETRKLGLGVLAAYEAAKAQPVADVLDALDNLKYGLKTCVCNARSRDDKYDVGYMGAMLTHTRSIRATVAALIESEARLREALIAFAEHFGPLEDNDMLNDDARRCFSLARDALKETSHEAE